MCRPSVGSMLPRWVVVGAGRHPPCHQLHYGSRDAGGWRRWQQSCSYLTWPSTPCTARPRGEAHGCAQGEMACARRGGRIVGREGQLGHPVARQADKGGGGRRQVAARWQVAIVSWCVGKGRRDAGCARACRSVLGALAIWLGMIVLLLLAVQSVRRLCGCGRSAVQMAAAWRLLRLMLTAASMLGMPALDWRLGIA